MFKAQRLLSAALVSVFVMGCSTTPRSFAPVLTDPGAAGPAFDATLKECTQLVNADVRSNFSDHPLRSVGGETCRPRQASLSTLHCNTRSAPIVILRRTPLECVNA